MIGNRVQLDPADHDSSVTPMQLCNVHTLAGPGPGPSFDDDFGPHGLGLWSNVLMQIWIIDPIRD